MKVTADRNVDGYRPLDSTRTLTENREIDATGAVDADRKASFAPPPLFNDSARESELSLSAQLTQATSPVVDDPELHAGERGIALLQHVVDNVLPQLDTGGDIAELATQLINEEIGMRIEWEARRVEESET
ncbi:hypothetical protein [Halomonas cupida]|uniref:Uncharacterized protein n=1 Tax=Halomonas cupida TaxID=44933 RepID=A0A1M7EAL8_9GAMM|nr:hypothetical protein [Halomonas cupida]GEN22766.1 hypothetical protein HCU01_07150 [Halomonas cupida]SHL88686.1 hypothetical protein SAMN05660971_01696 [Halomonas cupida]